MGAKHTKIQSKASLVLGGATDRSKLSLGEKEREADADSMVAYTNYVQQISEDQALLARSQIPEDNSEFADRAFSQKKLPLDEEGYVQSFHEDQHEAIRGFFQQYGFVVVRDTLSPEEIERSSEELWDAVERYCPTVRRDDASTWERWVSLGKLGFLGSSIVLSPQFCANRQHPKVHRVFSTLFGTEELHVNVSRASVMRPTKGLRMHADDTTLEKPEWRTLTPEKWLHWDMNPFTGATTSYSWRVTSLQANRGYSQLRVQGLLALAESSQHDGGFCCVPGSHSFLRTWAHHALTADPCVLGRVNSPYGPMQFMIPPDDDLVQHIAKVPVRAGSLLVWNSQLAHCNYPNESARPRMAQYITMKRADDEAFEPDFTDRALLPTGFELTPLGERLYGFKPYPVCALSPPSL